MTPTLIAAFGALGAGAILRSLADFVLLRRPRRADLAKSAVEIARSLMEELRADLEATRGELAQTRAELVHTHREVESLREALADAHAELNRYRKG